MVGKTLLLAGIPRSGTTLACSLLNQLPDTLALVESMDMNAFVNLPSSLARNNFITSYDHRVRESVLERGEVQALEVGGSGTNTFATHGETGKRATQISGIATVTLEKHYAPDFRLIIKHPNAFSALLPELKVNWPCYAIVRNPLAILASWNSLDHPLRYGHAPVAESFNNILASALNAQTTDLGRQLVLMNWYFARYRRYLPAEHIIRYEDIVASRGRALAPLVPTAANLNQVLHSHNANRMYDTQFVLDAATQLQQWNNGKNSWSSFYDEASIAALAAELTADRELPAALGKGD